MPDLLHPNCQCEVQNGVWIAMAGACDRCASMDGQEMNEAGEFESPEGEMFDGELGLFPPEEDDDEKSAFAADETKAHSDDDVYDILDKLWTDGVAAGEAWEELHTIGVDVFQVREVAGPIADDSPTGGGFSQWCDELLNYDDDTDRSSGKAAPTEPDPELHQLLNDLWDQANGDFYDDEGVQRAADALLAAGYTGAQVSDEADTVEYIDSEEWVRWCQDRVAVLMESGKSVPLATPDVPQEPERVKPPCDDEDKRVRDEDEPDLGGVDIDFVAELYADLQSDPSVIEEFTLEDTEAALAERQNPDVATAIRNDETFWSLLEAHAGELRGVNAKAAKEIDEDLLRDAVERGWPWLWDNDDELRVPEHAQEIVEWLRENVDDFTARHFQDWWENNASEGGLSLEDAVDDLQREMFPKSKAAVLDYLRNEIEFDFEEEAAEFADVLSTNGIDHAQDGAVISISEPADVRRAGGLLQELGIEIERVFKARGENTMARKEEMGEFYLDGGGVIELSLEDAQSISGPGPADDNVADLRRRSDIRAMLDALDAEDVRQTLAGYGAWDDEELADDDENLTRILWIAGVNIAEEAASGKSARKDVAGEADYWISDRGERVDAMPDEAESAWIVGIQQGFERLQIGVFDEFAELSEQDAMEIVEEYLRDIGYMESFDDQEIYINQVKSGAKLCGNPGRSRGSCVEQNAEKGTGQLVGEYGDASWVWLIRFDNFHDPRSDYIFASEELDDNELTDIEQGQGLEGVEQWEQYGGSSLVATDKNGETLCVLDLEMTRAELEEQQQQEYDDSMGSSRGASRTEIATDEKWMLPGADPDEIGSAVEDLSESLADVLIGICYDESYIADPGELDDLCRELRAGGYEDLAGVVESSYHQAAAVTDPRRRYRVAGKGADEYFDDAEYDDFVNVIADGVEADADPSAVLDDLVVLFGEPRVRLGLEGIINGEMVLRPDAEAFVVSLSNLLGKSKAAAKEKTMTRKKGISESDFPDASEVAAALEDIQSSIQEYDIEDTDVRLQVDEDGRWGVHSGDSSYDTDHNGYWGASSVGVNDSSSDLMDIARDLIEQALDQAAQSGDLDEKGAKSAKRRTTLTDEQIQTLVDEALLAYDQSFADAVEGVATDDVDGIPSDVEDDGEYIIELANFFDNQGWEGLGERLRERGLELRGGKSTVAPQRSKADLEIDLPSHIDEDVYTEFCDNMGFDPNDEDSIKEYEEKFAGEGDSLQDFVQQFVDDQGGLSTLDQQQLENYFDWEAYARDWKLGGDVFTIEQGGRVYVFWNN